MTGVHDRWDRYEVLQTVMKRDVEDSLEMSGKASGPRDQELEDRPVEIVDGTAAPGTDGQRPLPRAASEMIGRRLRQAYETQLKEPIPDRFSALLDDLAKGGRA